MLKYSRGLFFGAGLFAASAASACEGDGLRLVSGLAFDVGPLNVSPSPTLDSGCQVASFTLRPNYEAFLPEDIARKLSAGGVYPLTVIGSDAPVSFVAGLMALFDEVADRFANCRATSEGLTFCLPCTIGTCTFESAGFYFRGSDWAGFCVRPGANGARYCSTTYIIEPGFAVSYNFGRNGVDRDRIAELDAAVREAVMTLRAPEMDRIPN